jgi:hypothetical protein
MYRNFTSVIEKEQWGIIDMAAVEVRCNQQAMGISVPNMVYEGIQIWILIFNHLL